MKNRTSRKAKAPGVPGPCGGAESAPGQFVAGSTNTGSVDDTPGLADVADRERVWLHVDAAYGGAARLSRRDGHR